MDTTTSKDPLILVTAPSIDSANGGSGNVSAGPNTKAKDHFLFDSNRLVEEEKEEFKPIPFPGSGGKLFQPSPSSSPSPLDRICISDYQQDIQKGEEEAKAASQSAPAATTTSRRKSGDDEDLLFSPSLTTNFPFPPSSKIPVAVAAVSLGGKRQL